MNKLESLKQKLKTIFVDFNSPLHSGSDVDLIRLTTYGSLASLKETGAQVGEKVILDDGDELWVEAVLVKQGDDGHMYARFNWHDIVVKDKRVGPQEVKTAFELIRTEKVKLTPKDHPDLGPFFLMRLVSDALDLAERDEAEDEGTDDD